MALGVALPVLKATSGERRSSQFAVQAPPFFLCPIHMEIMRDPVALSTGMTYDRASIEKWLQTGHNTCPTTNQTLLSQDLIPNHTLRRAIQSWCVANGVERIATPKSKQLEEPQVVKDLLLAIAQCRNLSPSLKSLNAVAEESSRNRRCVQECGAVAVLAATLANFGGKLETREERKVAERAVGVIALLQLDEDDKKALSAPKAFSCLGTVLASGSSNAKLSAADVIHSVCGDDAGLKSVVGSHPGALKGLVSVLRKEGLPPKAVKLGLRCLLSLSFPKRNRIVAIESRAVNAVVEIIPRNEKRNVEYALAILEVLANCAEGREAITKHPFAIPRIVDSLVGVSNSATEHAVAALGVVISLASNRSVINTALRAGAFTKLLMLLPSDCSQRAKVKARDALKVLNEVWGTYTLRPDEDSGISIQGDLIRPRSQFHAES